MDSQHIRYEIADRVATITLDRPDKLNAFTRLMRDELIEAFGRADADDEVRAVIVTGAALPHEAEHRHAVLLPVVGRAPF